MNKIAKFSVKAKADRAEVFRRAFHIMDATITEDYVDEEQTVICFKVKCDASKTIIMEKEVPLDAYAGIGINPIPPLY